MALAGDVTTPAARLTHGGSSVEASSGLAGSGVRATGTGGGSGALARRPLGPGGGRGPRAPHLSQCSCWRSVASGGVTAPTSSSGWLSRSQGPSESTLGPPVRRPNGCESGRLRLSLMRPSASALRVVGATSSVDVAGSVLWEAGVPGGSADLARVRTRWVGAASPVACARRPRPHRQGRGRLAP